MICGDVMGKYKKEWWKKVQQHEADFITTDTLERMLSKCKNEKEQVCLVLLYYTGARPAEILNLKMKHFEIQNNTIWVEIQTLKKGISRRLPLPRNYFTEIIVQYIEKYSNLRELRLFPEWHVSSNIRNLVYRVSDNTLTPYFFRHNRISQLARAGASVFDLQQWKGAKNTSSITPYLILTGSGLNRLKSKIK